MPQQRGDDLARQIHIRLRLRQQERSSLPATLADLRLDLAREEPRTIFRVPLEPGEFESQPFGQQVQHHESDVVSGRLVFGPGVADAYYDAVPAHGCRLGARMLRGPLPHGKTLVSLGKNGPASNAPRLARDLDQDLAGGGLAGAAAGFAGAAALSPAAGAAPAAGVAAAAPSAGTAAAAGATSGRASTTSFATWQIV